MAFLFQGPDHQEKGESQEALCDHLALERDLNPQGRNDMPPELSKRQG